MADRAVVYLRASTPGQADRGSLESQETACLRLIQQRGYLHHHRDVFADVMTGRVAGARKSFYELLARLDQGDVQVLVSWDTKRLGRNWVDSAILARTCRARGVRIENAEGGAYDLDDPHDRFMLQVLNAADELNAAQILANLARGRETCRGRGNWTQGPAPFGYVIQGERARKVLQPVEPAASIVRRVFDLYDGGRTANQIAHQLQHEGVPCPRNRWGPDNVGKILDRPAYVGILEHDGQWIRGQHPPLIDRDLWDRVQERRRARRAKYPGRRGRIALLRARTPSENPLDGVSGEG